MRHRSLIFSLLAATGMATLALADAPPASPTPAKQAEILAAGKKVYETNCLMCHGAKGKGDGAAAAALNPKPRNLSDSAYMKKRPVETLRKVINEGGQSVGLSPVMVGWKAVLKPAQIESVLQYVLSLSGTTGAPAK